MGKRGPQPGFKAAAKAAPAVAPAAAEAAPPMSAQDRENPAKLSGEALKALAHRRGMARSSMADMSDEKIRVQLKYLTYRQYDPAEA